MVFLVCYSKNPPHDHAADKAAYLDQSFYELIYTHCRGRGSKFETLGEIASLRYKSPEFAISYDQLPALNAELERLANSCPFHPQVAELRSVCSSALSKGCSLTVSADMYPELGYVEVARGETRANGRRGDA